MRSSRPPSPEPLSRASIISGFGAAALELFGREGLDAIADGLPGDARAETVNAMIGPMAWVPTRYLSDWHAAVWHGPARESDEAFARFVQRGVDHGFGRIQRIFLKLASAEQLAQRAPEMWRRQHTHGELSVAMRAEARTATVTLRDHPFNAMATSRKAIAEVWRHLLTLIRLKNARQTHGLEANGALVVRVSWG